MTLTAQRLREVLEYDANAGTFLRKMPASRRHPLPWTEPAGAIDTKGYIKIKIDGRSHGAHRLAWLWMTGQMPQEQMDHIDGNRANNRWSNLREATQSQNQANSKKRVTNRSGLKGIYPFAGRWCARITKDRTRHFLGTFASPEEAHAAYRAASLELHGSFSIFR